MLRVPINTYILAALYFVAHGSILALSNSIFWDDWLIYLAAPETTIQIFTQQAGTLFYLEGYMHLTMMQLGPWAYKLFTLISMFCVGMLFNNILERHSQLSSEARFYIVLLFLVLPFNIARVALIDFRYTISYFLFFLAWSQIDRTRALALILFFWSFNTNSLLVFYALPIIEMFYRNGAFASIRSTFQFVIRRLDFLLLPFVYFFIKISFFSPSGDYIGYNEDYRFQNIGIAVQQQLTELWSIVSTQFLHLFQMEFGALTNLALILLLTLITYTLIVKRNFQTDGQGSFSYHLLFLGIFSTLLALFPYWIVGATPTFADWGSRHQLLMPLGVSLIFVALVSKFKRKARIVVLSAVVAISLACNISSYLSLFVDWQKQSQIIQWGASNTEIRKAGLVVIQDYTMDLNALFGRNYRFYEWNGLFKNALGDERRFCVQGEDLDRYLAGDFDKAFTAKYKSSGFRKEAAAQTLVVKINLIEPSGMYEKLLSRVFPKISILTSEVDLKS
jgi:hypothetical protein